MNKQEFGYCKLVFLLVFLLIVPTVSAQQTEEKVYDEVEKDGTVTHPKVVRSRSGESLL